MNKRFDVVDWELAFRDGSAELKVNTGSDLYFTKGEDALPALKACEEILAGQG